MKIEVKDNNIEQALRVLKRKLQRDGFFKVVKLKSVYEKPSWLIVKNLDLKYNLVKLFSKRYLNQKSVAGIGCGGRI